MAEELLAADEARQIGLEFIKGVYYQGKITINQVTLVNEGDLPVYHLEGSIKTPSRNVLGRLISQNTPDTLKIQVHAIQGSIISYEVR